MSTQLITFENNKLVLSSDIDYDAKVITVCGPARKGKSSLLNTICAYLNDNDAEIFKSSSSVDHVTHGISYCYFPDDNIMLIDTQGIDYGNSGDDHKILLFCYSISDIMIFNDKEMFNNGSLNSLSQLASFVNRINNNTKTELIIRIADYDLDDPIEKNIELTMKKQNDQYQNIRNAMNTLFPNITGLSTSYLTKDDKINMKQHAYTKVLSNLNNDYANCINSIITKIESCMVKHITNDTINKLIDAINNNNNIDHKNLDLYTVLSKNQLLEFQNNIPKELYDDIVVNGTQKMFEEVYMIRFNKYKEVLKNFDKMFNLIPNEIKDEYRKNIDTKLTESLEKAYTKTIQMAIEIKNDKLSNIGSIDIDKFTLGENSLSMYTVLNNTDYSNDERQILVCGSDTCIRDILYSITCYYANCLKSISHIHAKIYQEQKEIFSKSIVELETFLNDKYELTMSMKMEIDNNINELKIANYADKNINVSPLFDYINELDMQTIISYIYKDELDELKRNIPNMILIINNSMVEISEAIMCEYRSKDYIIETLIEYINNNQIKKEELQFMVSHSIYNDFIIQTRVDDISETKLKTFYDILEINYNKLIIVELNKNNNKIKWIMNTLNIQYNVLIPSIYVDNALQPVINNARIINYNIFIEYDMNESDRIQRLVYSVDSLFAKLMEGLQIK